MSGFETVSFLEPPFFGVKGYQNTAGPAAGRSAADHLQSVPRQQPAADASTAKAAGTESWAAAAHRCCGIRKNFKKAYNDRFNVNFQRQLPGQIVASVTYFLNLGNQHYTKALNNRRSAHPGRAARRHQRRLWTIRSTTT